MELGQCAYQREQVGGMDFSSCQTFRLSPRKELCTRCLHREARTMECGVRVVDGRHHRCDDTTMAVRERYNIA